MTAINSAIEIDLTGQVVADSIGSRVYSGVGGQMDFMRGAALADEGRAIIALPSTAARGTVVAWSSTLSPGAGVVTSRAHARTVVTEYGVAELFGRSLRERAAALIAHRPPGASATDCAPRRAPSGCPDGQNIRRMRMRVRPAEWPSVSTMRSKPARSNQAVIPTNPNDVSTRWPPGSIG